MQGQYLEALGPELRGRREILLKARQFGFSTLILALLFLDTLAHPHTQTVVIAHDTESTERLFQMVHRFQKLLEPHHRKPTKYSSRRELYWEDLDSYFFVGTAGTGEFGRGGTINNVHGSEVAFWPDADSIVSGLLQSVPADGNVFLESTARGMANWFYDEYQAARRGASVFTDRFYGWDLHEEYRVEPAETLQRTEEEKGLAGRYQLDDAQLNWRRTKLKELRGKFVQEYPLNAQEAFISSGGRILTEFIPEVAPAGHLVRTFVPPRDWRHYLIIDPGWVKTAGLFAAVDPDGRLWLYDEHYQGEWRPRQHLEHLQVLRTLYGKPAYDVVMDPAGFTLRRTDTGHEHPSWAAEFREAAEAMKAEGQDTDWFVPRPANNGDPLALRPKRYLATDMVRVCQHLTWWQWEADRWVRKAERKGPYSAESAIPEDPIKRNRHLMDCTRYLCNELPDPLPVPEAGMTPLQEFWERKGRIWDEAEREGKREARGMGL